MDRRTAKKRQRSRIILGTENFAGQ
uniref:Uncharacterized protein n=1 Tax=Rhizophora mucronata TaxID=61149 RepID=A0A2P2JV78_RHIMU